LKTAYNKYIFIIAFILSVSFAVKAQDSDKFTVFGKFKIDNGKL